MTLNIKKILQFNLFEFIIILIWIVLIFIINPIGNFPLNDDWVFAKVVETILKEGRYIPGNLPMMTLIAQAYWGSIFCFIFGYSFTILRISTLVLGIIGILFLFRLLIRTTLSRIAAFIGSLLIMINPFYLSLSFTFMTDVPFASMCILTTFLFYEYYNRGSILILILASIFSILSVMIRQLGLLLPFAFGITYLLSYRISAKSIIKATLPLIISLLLFLIFSHWIKTTRSMSEYYNTVYGLSNSFELFHSPFKSIILHIFFRIGDSLLLCAFSLAPLIIFLSLSVISGLIKRKMFIPLGIAAIITILYSSITFFKGNVLYNFGLGPKLLRDTYLLHINISPMLNNYSILIISILGHALLYLLIILLFDSFVKIFKILKKQEFDIKFKALIFSFIMILFYIGYFSISIKYLDRYLLLSIIFVLILLIISYYDLFLFKSKIKLIFSFCIFLIIGYFSLGGTYDYLSWNRARWEAIKYLTKEEKISPLIIDGGYEFKGLYNTEESNDYVLNKSSWDDDKNIYIISFGKILNYNSIKTYYYPYILPGTKNKIEILKKESL